MSKPEPFAFTEAELSDDARAILACARQWGTPFTRREITDIAPGAAWDEYSRWPKTVAPLDPIRELVRAGLVVEHDEQPTRGGRAGRATKHYKRWRLTGDDAPRSLAELLDALLVAKFDDTVQVGELRDEILRRFDRPGSAP